MSSTRASETAAQVALLVVAQAQQASLNPNPNNLYYELCWQCFLWLNNEVRILPLMMVWTCCGVAMKDTVEKPRALA
jgi:hypothetical protein